MVNIINIFVAFFAMIFAWTIIFVSEPIFSGLLALMTPGTATHIILTMGLYTFYFIIGIAFPVMAARSDENILDKIAKTV